MGFLETANLNNSVEIMNKSKWFINFRGVCTSPLDLSKPGAIELLNQRKASGQHSRLYIITSNDEKKSYDKIEASF